jgi:hypothetical protein
MSELRLRRGWAHWGFRVLAGLSAIGFGCLIVAAFRDPRSWGEGIRIIVPSYVLACYWALAIVFNSRNTLVTPDFVRVMGTPFPTRRRRFLRRETIRRCYARNIVFSEDEVEISNFYMAGVETERGEPVDLFGPFPSSAEALRSAGEIAQVLNEIPGRQPIGVDSIPTTVDRSHIWRAIAWGAAFLLAILAGAVWEISQMSNGIHYAGPRFW